MRRQRNMFQMKEEDKLQKKTKRNKDKQPTGQRVRNDGHQTQENT